MVFIAFLVDDEILVKASVVNQARSEPCILLLEHTRASVLLFTASSTDAPSVLNFQYFK